MPPAPSRHVLAAPPPDLEEEEGEARADVWNRLPRAFPLQEREESLCAHVVGEPSGSLSLYCGVRASCEAALQPWSAQVALRPLCAFNVPSGTTTVDDEGRRVAIPAGYGLGLVHGVGRGSFRS